MNIFRRLKHILKIQKPRALTTKFKFNPEVFDNFKKTLRNHQIESIKSLDEHDIGQINIPTGTGKTYIQKYIHVEDMIKKTLNKETGTYVIASHRLGLNNQLFEEIVDLIIRCGIRSDFVHIGSDRYDFNKLKNKYKTIGYLNDPVKGKDTLSSEDIIKAEQRARKRRRHLFIVTTYHSIDRLNKLPCIDICTFDEAHTTVNNEFTNNIAAIKPYAKRQYFFTATRKVINDSGGQADENFYGPVLYEMSPREAVEIGEMVKPLVHIVQVPDKINEKIDSKNVYMLVKTVIDSFIKHENTVKINSKGYNLAAKILVTVTGLDEIKYILLNQKFIDWCGENKVTVFSFSSKDGESFNFKRTNRNENLKLMQNLKDEEKALLFHYDILTEGIDIPTLTGTLLLRGLSKTKLLQNIGRASRLFGIDRERLYKGEILPNETDKMIKPYSSVILPTYINDDTDRITKILFDLRTEYNIPIEPIGTYDSSTSEKEESMELVTDKIVTLKNKEEKLIHMFEDRRIKEVEEAYRNATDKLSFIKEHFRENLQMQLEIST